MQEEGLIEVSETLETQTFSIKDSAKAFSILSDTLYMNKVLAVIRELSTNAFDAHIDAGTIETPFIITLPTENTPSFSIRDFGTGIPHEQVMKSYSTYFESTKDQSNLSTGALGLGSKSPLSIVDGFSLFSFQNGITNSYFVYKENGYPNISFIGSTEDKTEQNGIKIQFGVRFDMIRQFHENYIRALQYFEVKPEVINKTYEFKEERVLFGDDVFQICDPIFYVSTHGYSVLGAESFVVMARVAYPIDKEILRTSFEPKDQYLISILDLPVRFFVENREIEHTPSRENLQYNKANIKKIRDLLLHAHEKIKELFQKEFETCKNQSDLYRRVNFLNDITPDRLKLPIWKKLLRYINSNDEYRVLGRYCVGDVCEETVGKVVIPNSLNVQNFYRDYCYLTYNHSNSAKAYSYDDLAKLIKALQSFSGVFTLETYIIPSFKSFSRFKSVLNGNFKSQIEVESLRKECLKAKSKITRFESAEIQVRTFNDLRVDDFGNAYERFKNFTVKFNIKELTQDIIVVIDDNPKHFSTPARVWYHSLKDLFFTNYVIVSSHTKKGNIFDIEDAFSLSVEDAQEIVKDFYTELCRPQGIKVIYGSELEVPEELIRRPKPIPKQNSNAILKDMSMVTLVKSFYGGLDFKMIPFTEKNEIDKLIDHGGMVVFSNYQNPPSPNDTPILLPSLNDDNVLYLKKNGANFNFTFDTSDDNNPNEINVNVPGILSLTSNGDLGILSEMLMGLIRFMSNVSNERVFNKKRIVIVNTKSALEKIKKAGKWENIFDYIAKIINSWTKEQYEMAITMLSFNTRLGIMWAINSATYTEMLPSMNSVSKEIEKMISRDKKTSYEYSIMYSFDNSSSTIMKKDFVADALSRISGCFNPWGHNDIRVGNAFSAEEVKKSGLLEKMKQGVKGLSLEKIVNNECQYFENHIKLSESEEDDLLFRNMKGDSTTIFLTINTCSLIFCMLAKIDEDRFKKAVVEFVKENFEIAFKNPILAAVGNGNCNGFEDSQWKRCDNNRFVLMFETIKPYLK
jgi:hypothetical protein